MRWLNVYVKMLLHWLQMYICVYLFFSGKLYLFHGVKAKPDTALKMVSLKKIVQIYRARQGILTFLLIRSRGLVFDSRRYQTFWEAVGLERGSLSFVTTIEELLGRKSSGLGQEIREYGIGDPLRWPRDTFYPQKLTLTSPTSSGRSVGIVHSQTKATEFSFLFVLI
jgi:hypothetical protein